MAEVLSYGRSITSMPENLLLEVFKHLSIKDLCTIGRVCRVWRRVARDNSLWRHVDLRLYRLNLQRMWKVIRTHFSDVLLTLQLRGYLHPESANWKKSSLSDAMLRELQERCPNLRTLGLTFTDLFGVSIASLPNSLTHLSVTHSLIPIFWFRSFKDPVVMPELTVVDLAFSSRTCNSHLLDLALRPTIRQLKLNGCYRVSEEGVQAVVDGLEDLETLEISDSACTDLNLHQIGRKLKKLQRLDLDNCQKITDDGLCALASGCRELTWLGLYRCKGVTDSGLYQLHELKKLKCVDVREATVTSSGVKQLREALKECEVICEAESAASNGGSQTDVSS